MLSKFSHLASCLSYIKKQPQLKLAAGLAILFMVDILSWLGWAYPWFGSSLTVILALGWFYLAKRNLVLGLSLLLMELIVGSLGHLFNFNWGETLISLRLALFMAALALMIWRLWIKQEFIYLFNRLSLWYGLSLAGLAWGLVVGLARGNSWGTLFLDINGYFYLLLWPLFLIMVKTTVWRAQLESLLKVALVWLGLRTILLFYLYSHFDAAYLWPVYQWYRDTALGEITYVSSNYFRVFSQSQIWSLLAAVAGLAYLAGDFLKQKYYRLTVFNVGFVWFNLIVVIISLSRSFWLGGLAAWLMIVLWLINKKWPATPLYLLLSFVLLLSSIGVVLFFNRLPLPTVPIGASNVLASRLNVGEAAGASRLNLLQPLMNEISSALVVGRGFGATVTYQTLDPRLIQSTAGSSGVVTVYALEWGYLDMWLKLGLIGLAAVFSFLLYHFWFSFKNWWRAGSMNWSWLWPVWLSLLVVNLTTPYLNHPLGLGALMLILAYVASLALAAETYE